MHHRQLCAVSSALLLLSLLPGVHPNLESSTGADAISLSKDIVISEFYPRALNRDEYFALTSLSGPIVNLRNWSVSDGEGILRFTNDTFIAHRMKLTISSNSSAFKRAYDETPDFGLDIPGIQNCVFKSGTFALADSGDSISLLNPAGNVVDFVGYGDTAESSPGWWGPVLPNLRQGEIAKRVVLDGLPRDTDSSSDWMTFREFKYGYTEVGSFVASLPAGKLVAFTSPDCSLDVVVDAVESAEEQIRICSYEFSSLSLTCSLLDALDRGVEVRILVDGSPAGGMDERQIECLSILRHHGGVVSVVNGNLSLKIVQHCGAMHAKYMVIDCAKSLILSENFVESGIPEDRVYGNRGWGVMMDDVGIAGYLCQLYDSDSRASRADVRDWVEDPRCVQDALLPAARTSNHSKGLLCPLISNDDATITIVPSPDGSADAPYVEPILSQCSSLKVEQFQVDLRWQDRWTAQDVLSPLLGGIISGMRRGSEVQMLMDSSWFNSARNEQIVNFFVSLAKNESLEGSFKCMDPRSPFSVVHNKGMVVDHRISLISSNNWCRASFASNREMAAIVDSEEVAGYFERAFELDWVPDTSAPNASAGPDIEAVAGQTVILDGSGSADDRAIVDWKWDTDSDGKADVSGCRVSHSWNGQGNFKVTLRVEDAWGNRATDEIVVRVTLSDGADPTALSGMPSDVVVGIPVTGALSILVGVLLARWWSGRPRKFNHPDSD